MVGGEETTPRARGRGLHARSDPTVGTRQTTGVLEERRESFGAVVCRGPRGSIDEAARRRDRSDAPVE
ncbi:unnamed protein product [Ectocarpus sp. 8 AP-2014]